jgi:toxin HigB-1
MFLQSTSSSMSGRWDKAEISVIAVPEKSKRLLVVFERFRGICANASKPPPQNASPASIRRSHSARAAAAFSLQAGFGLSLSLRGRVGRVVLTLVSLDDTSRFVIRSFRDKATEAVFNGESPKGFPADLVKVARRKLRYLDAASDLGDVRSPPGNRLEALAGDRKGQHSIRINDQFRVCLFGRRKARPTSRSWTTTRA